LQSNDWEDTQELEAFLSYAYEIKQTIEHRGYCTGAQGLMLLHDLKEGFCEKQASLEVLELPATLTMTARGRATQDKPGLYLSTMLDDARRILKDELQARLFELRPSNVRLVQMFMSKQMDPKDWMKPDHHKLAETLYKQWLRQAHGVVKMPTRESSPRKQAQKAAGKLFRGAVSRVRWKGPRSKIQPDARNSCPYPKHTHRMHTSPVLAFV
jgi:hypothetical protein